MGKLEDAIADTVLTAFDVLPAKSKPRQRDALTREWVPLSGIVLSRGNEIQCVALATGMKCLPQSKIPQAKGIVLHDQHAEILALRAFNYFLIQECFGLVSPSPRPSKFVTLRPQDEISDRSPQPFAVHESVQIHMYCSEAPCGDASMEIIMAAQEDATPWPDPVPSSGAEDPSSSGEALKGRGHFSQLGVVRRKPSRADAPPTLSKSCSDKLALKQTTSILSSCASLLIHPGNAYVHSLILPDSRYSRTACDRSFGPTGRMRPVATKQWEGGYQFRPFEVRTTAKEFSYSRRVNEAKMRLVPSNLSTVWTASSLPVQETLINGVLQGRKMFDPKGASRISKLGLWTTAAQVVAVLPALLSTSGTLSSLKLLEEAVCSHNYGDLKSSRALMSRKIVKSDTRRDALQGWTENGGDTFSREL